MGCETKDTSWHGCKTRDEEEPPEGSTAARTCCADVGLGLAGAGAFIMLLTNLAACWGEATVAALSAALVASATGSISAAAVSLTASAAAPSATLVTASVEGAAGTSAATSLAASTAVAPAALVTVSAEGEAGTLGESWTGAAAAGTAGTFAAVPAGEKPLEADVAEGELGREEGAGLPLAEDEPAAVRAFRRYEQTAE